MADEYRLKRIEELRIVLNLAEQNILPEAEAAMAGLTEEREKQQHACDTVSDIIEEACNGNLPHRLHRRFWADPRE